MITMLKSAALLSLIASAAAVSAAPEFTADGAPMVRVSYAGLDLNKPAGAAEFDHRINRAVARVCADASRELDRVMAAKRCRTTAMKEAGLQRSQAFAEAASRTLQLASR